MRTFHQYLKSLDACSDAIEWAANKTVEEVVATCHRGDWLLWLAQKCGIGLQPLTLAKGHCANTVRHLMTDERSIKAVDTAIAFGEGRASRDKLDTAAHAAAAAYADAYAATAAAAYAAAYADVYAADAARAAAYADAAAAAAFADAAAAYAAAYATAADICRQYIGELIIEKVNQQLNQTDL